MCPVRNLGTATAQHGPSYSVGTEMRCNGVIDNIAKGLKWVPVLLGVRVVDTCGLILHADCVYFKRIVHSECLIRCAVHFSLSYS